MGTINITKMWPIMCLGRLIIPSAAKGEAVANHSSAQLSSATANCTLTRATRVTAV